jgi:hypothetical protein
MPYAMTLRVYTLDGSGRVTSDTGTKTFAPPGQEAGPSSPLMLTTAYPPCACYRCRAAR